MSRVDHILQEINALNADELELIYQKIVNRINRKAKATEIFEKYRGKGKGVWNMDAQAYVNEERAADRA